MATKPKAKSKPTVKPRNELTLAPRYEGDTRDEALAWALMRPAVQAACTIQRLGGDTHEVNALAGELQQQVDAVNRGDLRRAEGMLIGQAHTLDELFNNLARRSHSNFGHSWEVAETYMRLALKAQSQCRATLETLAAIKNPPIVYAKQANIANGPQQVNNGLPAPSQAGEKVIEQSKLLGGGNELLPDARASGIAGEANQAMEAMAEIDRAEVWSG